MFVPVGCTNCGKPFQVPEAALGQSAPCPWCQSVVTALPIAKVVEPPPASAPPTTSSEPQPNPATDQTPPSPKWLKKYTTERPRAHAIPVAKPTQPQPLSLDADEPTAPKPPEPARKRFNPVPLVAVLVVSVLVMGLTVLFLGYGSGRAQDAFWTQFTPPDGSCSVLLPASPVEENVSANPAGSVGGGKRYTARSWYTRSSAWLAWNDLDSAFAKAVAADKDRAFTASALKAELDREKARLQGTVTKEATVQASFAWGYEVHMDTPRGKVVEWLLLASTGPHPRLYVYGIQATNIAHDSALVRRMFTSFKIHE